MFDNICRRHKSDLDIFPISFIIINSVMKPEEDVQILEHPCFLQNIFNLFFVYNGKMPYP